jgi:hypothetical protein
MSAAEELNHMPKRVEYVEPDPSQLKRVGRVSKFAIGGLLRAHRIKELDGSELVFEPRQEGVTRYHPVIVSNQPYPRDWSR